MHHTRAHLLLSATLLVGGIFGIGCNPNSIGRLCVNPQASAPLGPQVVAPALECPSRLCLIEPSSDYPDTGRTTCTAQCSDNSDCDAETKASCKTGFVCAVATQVGEFCCQKLCICKDDLVAGFNETTAATDPQVATPYGCDPTVNSNVTCANVKQ